MHARKPAVSRGTDGALAGQAHARDRCGVLTTAGTTAHVFLDNALRENKMSGGDIELTSMPMADAVNAFIGGSSPRNP